MSRSKTEQKAEKIRPTGILNQCCSSGCKIDGFLMGLREPRAGVNRECARFCNVMGYVRQQATMILRIKVVVVNRVKLQLILRDSVPVSFP